MKIAKILSPLLAISVLNIYSNPKSKSGSDQIHNNAFTLKEHEKILIDVAVVFYVAFSVTLALLLSRVFPKTFMYGADGWDGNPATAVGRQWPSSIGLTAGILLSGLGIVRALFSGTIFVLKERYIG